MLFIAQSVEKGQGGGGGRHFFSFDAVSVAESQLSVMTSTLSGMSDNIAGLLNASRKHQRKIEKVRIKHREENLFSSSSSSSSEDEIRSNQGNQDLARGSFKKLSNKRNKGT